MPLPFDLGTGIGDDSSLGGSPATVKVRDLLTGPSGDLVLSGGDLQLVGELDSIVQDASAALKVFQGEWFLDTSIGVPWFQTILVKDPSLDLVRAAMRNALLDVPGIVEILQLQLDYNPAARTLAVTWQARADTGVIDGSTTVGV